MGNRTGALSLLPWEARLPGATQSQGCWASSLEVKASLGPLQEAGPPSMALAQGQQAQTAVFQAPALAGPVQKLPEGCLRPATDQPLFELTTRKPGDMEPKDMRQGLFRPLPESGGPVGIPSRQERVLMRGLSISGPNTFHS